MDGLSRQGSCGKRWARSGGNGCERNLRHRAMPQANHSGISVTDCRSLQLSRNPVAADRRR
ncbi:MAG TPA: hypothetical protein DDW98_12285, partial [Gammaproteobacteria bacterium]|nr:hypothetical protein [Gammaproteobacteria bacterium]